MLESAADWFPGTKDELSLSISSLTNLEAVYCPVFRVVHMHVTSIGREVSMGQGPSRSIKRVTITMLICDKLYLDMDTLT